MAATQKLLRHVTSSSHNVEFKQDIVRHTTTPPSLAVISFYILEVKKGVGRNLLPLPVVGNQKPSPGAH